jgi:hypothetical protein
MMLPPSAKQLCDTLATGIAGLEFLDALDGITAFEGHQRITAPFCPFLEAPQRLAVRDISGVLPPPPPDRERCGQEFRPPTLDIFEKSSLKRA